MAVSGTPARLVWTSVFAEASGAGGSDAAASGPSATFFVPVFGAVLAAVFGTFFAARSAEFINSSVTSSVMVGILHLAAICSVVSALASTNSTCLDAAGDFASGRTAITRPVPLIALWISWRAAIGMAQWGSTFTTT